MKATWITLILLGLASPAVKASEVSTAPIGSLMNRRGVAISGRVESVFGKKFILSDGTGTVLVDAGPKLNIRQGEQLTVVGEMDDDDFDAFEIRRAGGEVLRIREPYGPPPWSGERLGLASPAVEASTAPIGSLMNRRGVAISGRVESVSGNKFILSDGTGTVLVDAGPTWFHQLNIRQGEQLTVVGEMDDDDFDAFEIRRAGGEVLRIREPYGPPPWSGGRRRFRR